MPRLVRRATFWGSVAAVSIAANFGWQLLAARVNSPGLRKAAAFTGGSALS